MGNRSPVTVGFDTRAYDEGARIIQAVARGAGRADADGGVPPPPAPDAGSSTRSPRSTLADEIHAFSGVDFHERFEQWLYSDTESATAAESPHAWLHQVDMTPPAVVRRLYER